MNWKKKCLAAFQLYAVTNIQDAGSGIIQKIDQALAGGVDIIQLRAKRLTGAAFLRLGLQIRKIAHRRRKLFFVNDRVDLMLAAGADGVHLGQDDLPIDAARKLTGGRAFIGISTHSLAQAKAAEQSGADYIGFGPIFRTPTKPDYPPVGLNDIRRLKKIIKIPFLVIGGIDSGNVRELARSGAERIAAVRAIFGQRDTKKAALTLKEELRRGIRESSVPINGHRHRCG